MIKNNILINTETRKIKSRDYDFLGVAGENNIEQIVFKLSAFIEGEAILEIEKYNKENSLETHYFELQKQEESYIFEVKSSLLDVAKVVKMQLHITTENVEVFKSKIFEMKVYEAINATQTIPEEYEEWIDIANSKIALIDRINTNFTKLKEDVEKAETERTTAENSRSKAENGRIKAEQERKNAEDSRISSEEIRKKNESNRIVNENGRVEAENTRISAETTRTNNENKRIENENKRITAEEKRQTDTTNAINNINNLNEEYKQLAEEKTAELNTIAEVVEDMASALQHSTFKVESNMHLKQYQAKKMKNTRFSLKNGHLGVKVII